MGKVFAILFLVFSFGFSQTNKKAVVIQKSEMEKTIDSYKAKNDEIQKLKENNLTASKKLQAETELLKSKEDSLIIITKNLLKNNYDFQMSIIVSNEDSLRKKKEELTSIYQKFLQELDPIKKK